MIIDGLAIPDDARGTGKGKLRSADSQRVKRDVDLQWRS